MYSVCSNQVNWKSSFYFTFNFETLFKYKFIPENSQKFERNCAINSVIYFIRGEGVFRITENF